MERSATNDFLSSLVVSHVDDFVKYWSVNHCGRVARKHYLCQIFVSNHPLERVPLWCNVECVSNHRRLSRKLSASHGHAPLLTPRAVSFSKELNCWIQSCQCNCEFYPSPNSRTPGLYWFAPYCNPRYLCESIIHNERAEAVWKDLNERFSHGKITKIYK